MMRRITLEVVRGILILVWVFAASPIIAQPSSGGEEERLAGLIRTAEAEKDFGRVADAYRRVVALRPEDPAAWQGFGVAEALRGSFEEAVPALEKALTLDSKLWGAALYLGISYYRTNRFDAAVRPLEEAKKLRPGDPAIHYWLGASHNAAGRYPAAIAELRHAATARTDQEVLYLLARSYAEYAAHLEQELLRSEPDSAAAARVRAGDAAVVDSREAAIAELHRAIGRHPDVPGLYFDLGTLLWIEKRYDEAAAAFRREVVLDPSNAEAHRRLGAYLLETGRATEAMPHLEMALRLRPDDASIQELRRVAAHLQSAPSDLPDPECKSVRECYARGNLSRATEMLELQAERKEGGRETRLTLARAYMAAGRMEATYDRLAESAERDALDSEELSLLAQAAQNLSRETADLILKHHPESARAYMMHGEGLERQRGGDNAGALAAYRTALKLDPGLTGTHYAVGRVLWKLRRLEEAAGQLAAELRQNPHHGGAHYYLGRTYQSLGDNARAAGHLEQAVAANPQLTDGWRALGRARMGIGQPEAAIEAYRQALLTAPNDSGLYALLGAAHKAAGHDEEARESFATSRRLSAARFQTPAGDKP